MTEKSGWGGRVTEKSGWGGRHCTTRNLVYLITCTNCAKQYVGETKREKQTLVMTGPQPSVVSAKGIELTSFTP